MFGDVGSCLQTSVCLLKRVSSVITSIFHDLALTMVIYEYRLEESLRTCCGFDFRLEWDQDRARLHSTQLRIQAQYPSPVCPLTMWLPWRSVGDPVQGLGFLVRNLVATREVLLICYFCFSPARIKRGYAWIRVEEASLSVTLFTCMLLWCFASRNVFQNFA